MDVTSIFTALITGSVTLFGVVLANRKQSAVMQDRIERLTTEVEKHNGVLERMFKLEAHVEEHDTRTDARLNKIEEEITYMERSK